MTGAITAAAGDVREQILEAVERGAALRVVGGDHWLDAGRPVRTLEGVSTRNITGIVEYVPGDLTLTARAGTTLAEIRDATREHGQWLALDPPGTEDGTLGATFATASAGPLATAFGRARDLVLGVEFVTGAGAIARAGGRVVKNVAGFDVTRLMTGAWGTLGVLTEISVRLHVLPEVDVSVGVSMAMPDAITRVRHLLRRLPFTPHACEFLNNALAYKVAGSHGPAALFRLGGNAKAVAAQRAALGELGTVQDVNEDVWHRLRAAEPETAMVFRLSERPSEIKTVWNEATAIAARCPGTLLHASPARGVVRCLVPWSDGAANAVRTAFAVPSPVTRLGERLPRALWAHTTPTRGAEGLMTGIKRAFDPKNVLNPGILGDT